MSKRKETHVPCYSWNGKEYGNITLVRLFNIINNHRLGMSTRQYDWGCLSGCECVISDEEDRLPMILVPEGLVGIKINFTDNVYKCRLQMNNIIESSPYTLGHFRPYGSDYIVVLMKEDIDFTQVLLDLNMLIFDPTPIGCDEMIRLTYDPHSWLEAGLIEKNTVT